METGKRILVDASFVAKKVIGKEFPLNFSKSAPAVDGGWLVIHQDTKFHRNVDLVPLHAL